MTRFPHLPSMRARNSTRFRPTKSSTSLRLPSFFASRNATFFVALVVAFILLSRNVDHFHRVTFDSMSLQGSSPLLHHGLVKVDNIIHFDGSNSSQSTVLDDDEHDSNSTSKLNTTQQALDSELTHNIPPDSSDSSASRATKRELQSSIHNHQQPHFSANLSYNTTESQNQPSDDASSVAFAARSHAITVREFLNFTPATAINFMHFHKTGGVSFKTSLHSFYDKRRKKDGSHVRLRDTCYARQDASEDPKQPSFMVWRCDWDPVREMNETERNKFDFTFGHQFTLRGISSLLNKRDLRTFTILRHPFARKVSFYYHFFVRELGRSEQNVTYSEIKNFLLHDKLIVDAHLGRDLGPNYMAGRLLSDGKVGYVGKYDYKYYEVKRHEEDDVANQCKDILREYVFVGLQTQSDASKCMFKRIVEAFNGVHGVDNSDIEVLDRGAKRANSGSYSMTASKIWKRLSKDEKGWFERKEKVDLLIYREGARLFHQHVKRLGCSHRLVPEEEI